MAAISRYCGLTARVARAGAALAVIASALLVGGAPASLRAAVLPEDRADVLYHSYDGDNVTISGPSVLVRKSFATNFSASANYYVDKVSSASIDVVTTASPYTEERTQYSLGLDYLRDSWILSVGLTQSEETDYLANNFSIGISQDVFGDLTTISLGYSLGRDEVGRRGDPLFSEDVERQQYRLGLSQILTQNLLMGLSFESITDEGFLNNPYRSVRFVDTDSAFGYSFEPEIYPRTRTSDAASIRMRYYLPYRAALHGEYRGYRDTWEISATSFELGYTHPIQDTLILEAKVRQYSQDNADFYADLFPASRYQNFMARDKELSTFSSTTLHFGASFEFLDTWRFVERGSVNISLDFIQFDYEDFRDLREPTGVAGQEPFFNFDATVLQLFVSFWF